MTDPKPTRPARPHRTSYDRAGRCNRIFARLLEGQAYAAIAAAEGLTVRRVRGIVREALDRREIEPREEYVWARMARLDGALRVVEGTIAGGKLGAVPQSCGLSIGSTVITGRRFMSREGRAAPHPSCSARHLLPLRERRGARDSEGISMT
jgi:hypothetical protein